jgi:putative membrane protein
MSSFLQLVVSGGRALDGPAKLHQPEAGDLLFESPSVELSSNRTSLSFERTRMSADRTLMAGVRTALSLISFGFTINEVYQQLKEKPGVLPPGAPAATYFGLALVLLGVGFLVVGLIGHYQFMKQLTERKDRLHDAGLVRHTVSYEPTATFLAALLLLVIGAIAAISIIWRSTSS